MHGWTTPHPKSRSRRTRITTVLLNTKTNERFTIGRCLKRFSEAHGLYCNDLCKLVNGRKILYRHWMLERTWLATLVPIARAMLPNNYVILDLKHKRAKIYSPYKQAGLLYTHEMTDVEYEKAMTLLTSDQTQNIPEHNEKMAFDAFEFDAQGTIDRKTLKFHHILPDNEAVLTEAR